MNPHYLTSYAQFRCCWPRYNWFVNEFAAKHRISTIDSFNWIINCAMKETHRKICPNLNRAHFNGDNDNEMTISVHQIKRNTHYAWTCSRRRICSADTNVIASNSQQPVSDFRKIPSERVLFVCFYRMPRPTSWPEFPIPRKCVKVKRFHKQTTYRKYIPTISKI